MIIPTPEFDPFFAPGPPLFRDRMLAYIHQQFSDLVTKDQLDRLTTPAAVPDARKELTPAAEEENRLVA